MFYFPGAGNGGDTNRNGNLEDNLDEKERRFLEGVRAKTNSQIEVIYPYGIGTYNSGGDKPLAKVLEGLKGEPDMMLGNAKANEILAKLLGTLPYNFTCLIPKMGELNDLSHNVTFIAYSGGGQQAYLTAQSLDGFVKVDNLITFGSPLRAYNGANNIDRIWEFVGEQDALYNNGLGTIPHTQNFLSGLYLFSESTYCVLKGSESSPYTHWGEGDYFDVSGKFEGANCMGAHAFQLSVSQSEAATQNKTHLQASIDLAVAIIEGWAGLSR